jgi:hypothetical protein
MENKPTGTNPYGVKKGDIVLVDVEFANGGYEAEVLALSPNGMFALISAAGDSWEIMTRRLKPIKKD